MRRVPATITTGFLDAGKTSQLRHLLAAGRRLAVVVNEFGALGIDHDLLPGCGNAACAEDDIVELANGCLCCTVAADFLPTDRRQIVQAVGKRLQQQFDRPWQKGEKRQTGLVVIGKEASTASRAPAR